MSNFYRSPYMTCDADPEPMPPGVSDDGGGSHVPVQMPAKWWRQLDRDAVDYVVIHCSEGSERPNSAEGLGRYFADPKQIRNGTPVSVKCSAHYSVDSNSIVQHVAEKDAAWHVRTEGFNDRSIGIELCGKAGQMRAEWVDEFGGRMLPRAARLVARICADWDIPVRRIQGDALRAGIRGITCHRDLTMKFREDTHTDPGVNFPWVLFMAMVGAHQ